MPRRKAIKGVLHNFLGTYASRYSDYDGYWLFGFLPGDVAELRIDLLGSFEPVTPTEPGAAVAQFARARFKEQLEKAGIPWLYVKEAQLSIKRSPAPTTGVVNGHYCVGHEFTFYARAVTNYGRVYDREISLFIAPHNSALEQRSSRGT